MDNLSSHEVEGVREAIEAKGAAVRYLPPYSPDLNPIEMVFSRIQQALRKAGHRTVAILLESLHDLALQTPPEACKNFIAQAGYTGDRI